MNAPHSFAGRLFVILQTRLARLRMARHFLLCRGNWLAFNQYSTSIQRNFILACECIASNGLSMHFDLQPASPAG
jgi:hypothetical protein